MFKILALLLAFVAQLVVADGEPACTRQAQPYVGDSCDVFSDRNNVSTYQFAVVNMGIVDDACDNLDPSQQYCLGRQDEDCAQTHLVQLGDDCDTVASTYGTNTTILYANNPQLNSDCTNLYVGEVVCVASTVLCPPLPASGTVPASAIPATATPAPTDIPWCD
ncbi:hypothetical protein JVU11DRAFT_8378 [Chiua virens]|nr:hypothetical protein JVU11DRAFT_8378 [Chiua virens]